MARKTTIASDATLADLAGTTRGLSKLTVKEIKALLDGKAPAKTKAKAKPKSEFYEKVIVGGREQRDLRQKVNHEAAAWMREKGLVPSGQAWAAVKKGERNIKALRALNEADGLKPLERKAGVTAEVQTEVKTAKKARKAKPEPKPEPEPQVDEAKIASLVAAGFTEDEARGILA